jgi:hypothetical protein
MEYQLAMQMLEEEIKRQAADLTAYASREGSNETVIEMRNRTISKLTECYNGLYIPHSDLLLRLGLEMERLLKLDPHLSGFHILVNKKETGYPGVIQCSWI